MLPANFYLPSVIGSQQNSPSIFDPLNPVEPLQPLFASDLQGELPPCFESGIKRKIAPEIISMDRKIPRIIQPGEGLSAEALEKKVIKHLNAKQPDQALILLDNTIDTVRGSWKLIALKTCAFVMKGESYFVHLCIKQAIELIPKNNPQLFHQYIRSICLDDCIPSLLAKSFSFNPMPQQPGVATDVADLLTRVQRVTEAGFLQNGLLLLDAYPEITNKSMELLRWKTYLKNQLESAKPQSPKRNFPKAQSSRFPSTEPELIRRVFTAKEHGYYENALLVLESEPNIVRGNKQLTQWQKELESYFEPADNDLTPEIVDLKNVTLTYCQAGRYGDATKLLGENHELVFDSNELSLLEGEVHAYVRDFAKAKKSFLRVFLRDPQNQQLNRLLTQYNISL